MEFQYTGYTPVSYTHLESGTMTKDLALITTLENVNTVNSEDFIKAIRATLENLLNA